MIRKGLTAAQLKLIAISAMFLDHFVGVFISHNTITYLDFGFQHDLPHWYQLFILGAIPLLALYNGQKGSSSKVFSRAFYWFYPLHLLLIWVLKLRFL